MRTKYTYEDGGVHANNPAEVALEEVVALTTGDPKHPWHGRRIGCFVSLGCGRGPRRPASSIVPKVVKKLARIATNTAAVHRKMRRKLHVDDCGGSQPEPCGLGGGERCNGCQECNTCRRVDLDDVDHSVRDLFSRGAVYVRLDPPIAHMGLDAYKKLPELEATVDKFLCLPAVRATLAIVKPLLAV